MRAALLFAVVFGFYGSGAEARSDCSEGCDKEAAACVDACEAKHGNDAPARVGCKVKCAEQRGVCEKGCGAKVSDR